MPSPIALPGPDGRPAQAAAVLRSHTALWDLMNGPDGIESISERAANAALRLLWAQEPENTRVWVALHGLDPDIATVPAARLAATLGMSEVEVRRRTTYVAKRFRELIQAQSTDWSSLPAPIQNMLAALGASAGPSSLSPENAASILGPKAWTSADRRLVDRLLTAHGYQTIEELAASDTKPGA